MINICFFSGDITRTGGTERVSIILANALTKEPSLNISILSLTEGGDATFFPLDETIPRTCMSKKWITPGPGYLPLIPKLKKYLQKNDIDLIIDIDIVLDVLSVPASKGLKTKVISWEHFNYMFEQGYLYRRAILKHCTAKSDATVTLTNKDAQAHRDAFPSKNMILSINNPVEMPGKPAKKIKRKKAILTVGSLSKRKGTDLLIETAGSVLPDHPDWRWYVLGDGPDKKMLLASIRENGLEGQLIAKGETPDTDYYYDRASIYCLTSRTEGLPMVLLEAKAHGLPAVSFDLHTGPADIIDDGLNGILVPPEDTGAMAKALSNLMDDADMLSIMTGNVSDGLDRFSIESIKKEWLSLIYTLTV